MELTKTCSDDEYARVLKRISMLISDVPDCDDPDDTLLAIRKQCLEVRDFFNALHCYKPTPSWKSTSTTLFGISVFKEILEWILDDKLDFAHLKNELISKKLIIDCIQTHLRLMSHYNDPAVTHSILQCIEIVVSKSNQEIRLEVLKEIFEPEPTALEESTLFGVSNCHWMILSYLIERLAFYEGNLCDTVSELLEKYIMKVCENIVSNFEMCQSLGNNFSDFLQFVHLLIALDREEVLDNYLPRLSHYIFCNFADKLHDKKSRALHISLLRKVSAAQENGHAFLPSLDISRNVMLNLKCQLNVLHKLSKNILDSYFGGTVLPKSPQLEGVSSSVSDLPYFNSVEVMDLILVVTQAVWNFCSAQDSCSGSEEIENSIHFGNKLVLSVLLRNAADHPLAYLITLLSSQDDGLINFMILHLNISCSLKKLQADGSNLEPLFVSPNTLFIRFISSVSFDSSVLLDWLTSNETEFLLFLIKYLKYVLKYPDEFTQSCTDLEKESDADAFKDCRIKTKEMLTSLSESIEKLSSKKLFPYNASPLLRNLQLVLSVLTTPGTS